MKSTRTHNVLLIVMTSGIRQFINLVTQFVSRTVFIHVLGAEYLGLNGLFSNVLSLLSLTELGVGSAISFYLYQPLFDNDIERIKSLMRFYKQCYRVIGIIMLGAGTCIMPLLPLLVNFDQSVPINLYLVYFLFLLNTACSYLLFAYKQILPMANQEQYEIEKVNIVFICLNCIIDAGILVIFRNYILYLLVKLALVLANNFALSLMIDKKYKYIKEKNVKKIEITEIKSFFKDIKNAAIFRVGSALYNSTDNILISSLLGTVIVGYYSNYFLILTILAGLISLFVKSFTASVGNLMVEKTKEDQYQYFLQIDFIVYCLVSISTTCLFQLFNSFIALWIGAVHQDYILSQTVVAFLCINFYFDGTTQIMNIFRETGGYFQLGKSLQIAGGLLNIVLSILLGRIAGLEGIFAATVISKGIVSLFPFMLVISRDVFEKETFTVLKVYLKRMMVTGIEVMVVWYVCNRLHMTTVYNFLIEMFLSIIISIIIIFIFFYKSEEMRALMERINRIRKKCDYIGK